MLIIIYIIKYMLLIYYLNLLIIIHFFNILFQMANINYCIKYSKYFNLYNYFCSKLGENCFLNLLYYFFIIFLFVLSRLMILYVFIYT